NLDIGIMKEVIEKAKKSSDFIIVDMSWGHEYNTQLLNYQTEYAEKALEFGADIVLGTNSNIFQKMVIDGDRAILYGAGAFLPHTHTNSQSAIYTLTFYNNKLVAITPTILTFSDNRLVPAQGKVLDSLREMLYKEIDLR